MENRSSVLPFRASMPRKAVGYRVVCSVLVVALARARTSPQTPHDLALAPAAGSGSLAGMAHTASLEVPCRVCECGCSRPMVGKRPEARYATDACRVGDWARRNAAGALKAVMTAEERWFWQHVGMIRRSRHWYGRRRA